MVMTTGLRPSFTCTACRNEYPWVMRGGTHKMIGSPVEYSDRNVTQCAYCVGFYADCTGVNGGKR